MFYTHASCTSEQYNKHTWLLLYTGVKSVLPRPLCWWRSQWANHVNWGCDPSVPFLWPHLKLSIQWTLQAPVTLRMEATGQGQQDRKTWTQVHGILLGPGPTIQILFFMCAIKAQGVKPVFVGLCYWQTNAVYSPNSYRLLSKEEAAISTLITRIWEVWVSSISPSPWCFKTFQFLPLWSAKIIISMWFSATTPLYQWGCPFSHVWDALRDMLSAYLLPSLSNREAP